MTCSQEKLKVVRYRNEKPALLQDSHKAQRDHKVAGRRPVFRYRPSAEQGSLKARGLGGYNKRSQHPGGPARYG